MTRTFAIALLFFVVIAATSALLPATREEASWLWADVNDHAVDYKAYLEDWPNGRHASDARLNYYQRTWVESEQAMIHQAYQQASHSSAESDANYRNQKRLRQDAFFWKAATNGNTAQSYQAYIQQFPRGRFVRQARARIETLSHESQAAPPVSIPPPQ